MIPTAITSFTKKNYPQESWGKAVSVFTVFFAVGQIIGPTAAGFVADKTNSLIPGMAAAGGVLLCGAILAWMQKPLS
jgi:MFS family permease